MSDIALDLNKSSLTSNDFLIIDGDLAMTSDVQATGTNPVLQNILQRLRFFFGEWFLDNTKGVPWFEQILVKNPDKPKIDLILLNTILGTPGVISVSEYTVSENRPARVMTVTFKAISTSGPINYSGTLGAS